jgi:hypothetical protein
MNLSLAGKLISRKAAKAQSSFLPLSASRRKAFEPPSAFSFQLFSVLAFPFIRSLFSPFFGD